MIGIKLIKSLLLYSRLRGFTIRAHKVSHELDCGNYFNKLQLKY